jgi:hypothetical protein
MAQGFVGTFPETRTRYREGFPLQYTVGIMPTTSPLAMFIQVKPFEDEFMPHIVKK